ncbi:MAG: hypothetical protein CMJ49_13625 [Planctomycetaceae bacterium]|nr:hypothetical protein [Planctomycetaceae bacterium]
MAVEQDDVESSASPATPPVGDGLVHLVHHGRRRWRLLIFAEALGLTIAAPLAYLWLIFLLDQMVHLPIWGRALACAVFLACVMSLVIVMIRRWRRAQLTDDQVALAIERRTPGGLENRLINAIQLKRDHARHDASISQTVIDENVRHLQQRSLQQAATARPAAVRLGLAGLFIAIGLMLFWFHPDQFGNAAARIFQPFAHVDPIFRTILRVTPGDIEVAPGRDVTIHIEIEGAVPGHLVILSHQLGRKSTHRVTPDPGGRTATYTFEAIERTTTYAVHGGDFTTGVYQITVSLALAVSSLDAVLDYPSYTGLSDQHVHSGDGHLEALNGTRATVTFALNQPVAEAALLLERSDDVGGASTPTDRIPLRKRGDAHFTGDLALSNVTGYTIQATTTDGRNLTSGRHMLRAIPDAPAEVQLSGVELQSELAIDAILPVHVTGRDDYGLAAVELVYRNPSRAETTDGAPDAIEMSWQTLHPWALDAGAMTFQDSYPFDPAAMIAAEGELIELAVRGRDHDPAKAGQWSITPPVTIVFSSDRARLQILYEQILRTERELRELISGHESQIESAGVWMTKLDPASGLRWDDQKNLSDLAAAMAAQAKSQASLREAAANTARDMPEDAGSLRLSVAMLADTEMIRAIRIWEAATDRSTPQDKRGAVGDARLTQERTLRSLHQIHQKYVLFQHHWELEHMVPFIESLADRQAALADLSTTYGDLSVNAVGSAQRRGTQRRQQKISEMTALARHATAGIAERQTDLGAIMIDAFRHASEALGDNELIAAMDGASQHAGTGQWAEAASRQGHAAEELADIHRDLVTAQAEAAREVLAALNELDESQVDAQGDMKQLKPGTGEKVVEFDPDQVTLKDLVYYRRIAEEGRKRGVPDDKIVDYTFEDSMRGFLSQRNPEALQSIDRLNLARQPSGEWSVPNSSDREANRTAPNLQEELDDIVGNLLDEADRLREDFETYNLNTQLRVVDPGEVGKQGGDINSMGAAAATGNQKPPTHNFGGASRTGRQGARVHGLVAGNEGINRKGRDEAQEGQQEAPDQKGMVSNQNSSNMQQDTSTGVGGKRVMEQVSSFSTKDAGEWDDSMADRMQDPQKTQQIVERQGKPLDPRVAEALRDLNSDVEQVIQRIKAVRKELDKLYLPTDHLDDIVGQMRVNLDRLSRQPESEVFRRQMELLDRLVSTMSVFNRPMSDFQRSLRRNQVIKGRVLDQPASPVIPGYERAVKRYYQELAEP